MNSDSVNNFATVFGKTSGLFKRDAKGKPTNELADGLTVDYILSGHFTLKTDGTCGLLFCHNGLYYLCRRQDIRKNSRNFASVLQNGKIEEIASRKCFVSKMIRGSGKTEYETDVYIFMVGTDDKPELEGDHMIGFVPISETNPEDKYIMSTISDENISDNLTLYVTDTHNTHDHSLAMTVVKKSAADILCGKSLATVEIMGKKISDRYDFNSDQHFINVHGSITIPREYMPTAQQLSSLDDLKQWFQSASNPYANNEGFVIHFDDGCRIKCHRGYVGLEDSWKKTKSCGLKFYFE